MSWRKLILASVIALAPAALAMEPSSPGPRQVPNAAKTQSAVLPHVNGSPQPITGLGAGSGTSGTSTLTAPGVASGVVSGQFVSVRSKVVQVDVSGTPITLNAQALDFQSQLHDGEQVRAAYAVRNGEMQATKIWRVTPNGTEVVAEPPQAPPPSMMP